jgi:diaminopimelate decarboxylase
MSVETSAASLFRTEIAGVPIRELVERFGTPTYVYDAAKIAGADRRSAVV